MNLGFNIVTGCDCTYKYISLKGLFESFQNITLFRKLEEDIIPVIYRASCPKRDTKFCHTKCKRARYGIQGKTKTHWSIMNR